MSSLADTLLTVGLIPNLESVHGEVVTMLSGDDAGNTYTGVITLETDLVFSGDLGSDRRGKRTISFLGTVPTITSHSQLQDSAGKTWKVIRLPGDAYLATDFELVAVHATKDT